MCNHQCSYTLLSNYHTIGLNTVCHFQLSDTSDRINKRIWAGQGSDWTYVKILASWSGAVTGRRYRLTEEKCQVNIVFSQFRRPSQKPRSWQGSMPLSQPWEAAGHPWHLSSLGPFPVSLLLYASLLRTFVGFRTHLIQDVLIWRFLITSAKTLSPSKAHSRVPRTHLIWGVTIQPTNHLSYYFWRGVVLGEAVSHVGSWEVFLILRLPVSNDFLHKEVPFP